MQKIRRAIQRVNNPAPGWVSPLSFAPFFGNPAIGWARLQQLVSDNLLSGNIGLGDKITHAFYRHLQIFNLLKILNQRPACLAGGLHHNVQISAGLHHFVLAAAARVYAPQCCLPRGDRSNQRSKNNKSPILLPN